MHAFQWLFLLIVGLLGLVSASALPGSPPHTVTSFPRRAAPPAALSESADSEDTRTTAPALVAPRIVNGKKVGSMYDYPFMASILIGGKHECGGTILSETKILTAAHCITDDKVSTMQVRVGTLNARAGGQTAFVAAKDWHDNYRPRGDMPDYDVGILTLKKGLTLSKSVRKAKLPARKNIADHASPMTILGWGRLGPGQSAVLSAEALQKAQVWVLGLESCRAKMPKGRAAVTDRMFCAQASGVDTCKGDSGGPIVDARTGVVQGGVSWGADECADPDFPGVFMDYGNPELYDWIHTRI